MLLLPPFKGFQWPLSSEQSPLLRTRAPAATPQTPASGARPPGWLCPFPLRLPASPSVFFFVNSPLLSSSPFSRSVTTPRASPPPRAPARPGALPSRSSARPPHSCPCSRPGLCAAALTPHFFSFPLFLQTMYFCVQEHLKLFLLTK